MTEAFDLETSFLYFSLPRKDKSPHRASSREAMPVISSLASPSVTASPIVRSNSSVVNFTRIKVCARLKTSESSFVKTYLFWSVGIEYGSNCHSDVKGRFVEEHELLSSRAQDKIQIFGCGYLGDRISDICSVLG